MSKHRVAVIVPNWNGKYLLAECLRSLMRQTTPAEIIVIDNGSTDGSADYIKRYFPKATVLPLEKNYGFTGGVNRGIELAFDRGATHIALFNNDAVADPQWLGELYDMMERQPHTGIVTGKFMRMDKKHLDSTGEFIRRSAMPYSRGRDEIDSGQYDKSGYVFAATGGASLYRTKMLRQIGLFDEDFFAYFEDVDLSFRAQLMGWHVSYQPSAVAYHHIGKTSSKLGSFRRYQSIKNYIMLYNKNVPGILYWKYKPLFLWQLVRMFAGSIRDREVGAYLSSFGRSVLMIPGTLKKRRRIQSHRTVESAVIAQFIQKEKR